MGANIVVNENVATIVGSVLHGATVTAYDLRGGAALVIAGLNAKGRTRICGVENISRGYLDLAQSLRGLGADIQIAN